MPSTTAGVRYCFRNGRDAASSIPFLPCLMARKYLQEENACALGLWRFIHLSSLPRREPSYFLRCANSPPFFKLHCCAEWCRKACHHADCRCPWQWRSQTSLCSQDLEKLEIKRRITLLGSITWGRVWIRNYEVYVGRFCHGQLVLHLLSYTAEVSSCRMSPTWHYHREISWEYFMNMVRTWYMTHGICDKRHAVLGKKSRWSCCKDFWVFTSGKVTGDHRGDG